MKKNIVLLLVVLISHPVLSQTDSDKQSNFSAGADIVSRYIWRGINLGGPSPHIQPFVGYSAGSSGFAAGIWGSYGLGEGSALTEADLYITYSPAGYITFTVTDYFFPLDASFSSDKYFTYRKGATSHTIEASVSYNGTENFPFSLLFAMNLYGVDGTNEDGNNYYAKYIELGYAFPLGDFDIELFAGLAPDNPDTSMGAVDWYGNSGGLINVGAGFSRDIRISDMVEVPVFSSLIFNPEAGNIFILIGLSF